MKLVLLPGLDGTGLMFTPFLKYITYDIEVEVISLEQEEKQDYFEQANIISSKLGSTPIVLLAESYSGRLAYELCFNKNLNIQHVIFIASFLSQPSIVSNYASLLPLKLINMKIIPNILLKHVLFSSNVSNELIDLFYQAISEVSLEVLTQRLRNIEQLKLPTNCVDIPSTYIRASKDLLVSKNSISDFKKIFTNLKIDYVKGGHFLLQSNPEDCLKIIERVVNK